MANALGVIIALALMIWFIPLIGIGSINRLFDLGIEHTAENYLYLWVLMTVLGGFNPFKLLVSEDE